MSRSAKRAHVQDSRARPQLVAVVARRGRTALRHALWLGVLVSGLCTLSCGAPSHPLPPRPSLDPPSLPAPALGQARWLSAWPADADRGPTPPTAGPVRPVPPLQIVDWGPRGQQQAPTSLFLRFSQPMVALHELGGAREKSSTAPLISLETTPALTGKGFFQTPEYWVQDLPLPIQRATRYSIRLRPPLVAPNGARWEGVPGPEGARDLIWTFESERPRAVAAQPDSHSGRQSRTAPLLIEFTQRVSAAHVASFLQARDATSGSHSAPIPVRVSAVSAEDLRRYAGHYSATANELAHWVKVQPQQLWPIGAKVRVNLQPGWLGDEGPLPADIPWETELRTIPALRMVHASCTASKPCAQDPIVLHFSNEVPYDEIKKVRVSPEPEWLQVTAESGWQTGQDDDSEAEKENGPRVEIHGAFLPGRRYRVQIGSELRDVYQQRLGQPVDITAVFVRRPFLELSSEHGILREGAAQTIGVISRHVQSIEVRAQVLDDAMAVRLLSGRSEDEAAQDAPAGTDQTPSLPAPKSQFVRRIDLHPTGSTEWSSIAVDLAALSGHASGAILVEVIPRGLVDPAAGLPMPATVRGLFRLTDLGPLLTGSRPRTLLRVHRLSDGTPVAGAEITRHEQKKPALVLGRTDAHGVLSLPTPDDANWAQVSSSYVVHAPKNNQPAGQAPAFDRAYLTVRSTRNEAVAALQQDPPLLRRGEQVLAQLVTERDAYRAGEIARCVGWTAIETPYERSNLRRMPAEQSVKITLMDPRSRAVASADVKTTAEGKFFAEIPIPAAATLGHYHLRAEVLNITKQVSLRVEDFRTPEYAVSAAPDRSEVVFPERPHISVSATYFFGGNVKLSQGSARQICARSRFRPPQLEPDWRTDDIEGEATPEVSTTHRSDASQLPMDALPRRWQFQASAISPQVGTRRCSVSVTVADASQQALGAETSYLVHPARYYLALRPSTSAPQAGDAFSYTLRAVEADGTRTAADGVVVRVERFYSEPVFRTVDQTRVFDRYVEHSETLPDCALNLTAQGHDSGCRIPSLREGRYVFRVAGGPDAGLARLRTEVYVRPRERQTHYSPPPPPPRLALWLAADRVQPGEELVGRISAPWPARGVLVMARQGVREHIPFDLSGPHGGSFPLRLRVDDSWVPAVHFEVLAVRPPRNEHGSRPSVEQVRGLVRVDSAQRRLQVQVEAPRETLPSHTVPIHVRVRNHAGYATAARVALWAVDEAVLSLTRYEVPDLLPTFIPGQQALLAHHDEYRAILSPYSVTADPWLMPSFGRLGASGSGLGGSAMSARSVGYGAGAPPPRQRFETTPLFLGDVAVDDSGQATVHAQLPDNLTTFRITAIASARLVDGQSPGRFGKGDTRLRVTQPFLVRPVLPRLLRVGDQAELAALVNNAGGPAGTAEVSLIVHQNAAHPVLTLQSAATQRRPLPAQDLARVPFAVTATRAGTIELELRATLRSSDPTPLVDSVRVPLVVADVPRSRERVAVYGTIDDDQPVAVPLNPPPAARKDEGGLRLTASPSLLRDLDEVARSLLEYPHGCLEQTSSRLVPLVALSNVQPLISRKPGVDAAAESIADFAKAGIDRIASMQTQAGGFAYWPGGASPHLYATAYATWVLHLLRASPVGTAPDLAPRIDALLQASGTYLLNSLSPGNRDEGTVSPALQGPVDLVRSVMAMQVLASLGRAPAPLFDQLFVRRIELPAFARALLAQALQTARPGDPRIADLTHELLGTIGELPASAHVNEVSTSSMDVLFHSSARSDAMVLLTLLRTHRDHPLVPKLVRGLMSRRHGGVWRNTQENAYALLALAEYARVFEASDPAMLTRAWVGSVPIPGSPIRFSDRTSAPVDLHVPMPTLVSASRDAQQALLLQREGRGRLYYRLELTWTPEGPLSDRPARAQGLRLQRTLRTASSQDTHSMRLGEAAAVDLLIENRAVLNYVAIEVPLPAGLEVLQRNLGQGQASLMLPGSRSPFVSHEELRADRFVVFTDQLPPGKHHHTLYVRPTTPGHFVLPSAQGEAMYEPEVFGRTTAAAIDVK